MARALAVALLVLPRASAQEPPDAPWSELAGGSTEAELPTTRSGHSAMWCAALGGFIAFGGRGAMGVFHGDVWRWTNASGGWQLLTLAAGWPSVPRARAAHSAVCTGSAMLVFGGSCGADCYLDDVWVLRSHEPAEPRAISWVEQTTSAAVAEHGTPEPRAGHGAVWHHGLGQMLVFGGQLLEGGALVDDAWALTGSYAWRRLSAAGASGAPGGRRDAAIGLLSGRMLVFGGWRGYDLLSDLWELHVRNATWAQLATEPSGRRGAAMASSPDGTAVALFGGAAFAPDSVYEEDRSDVWLFTAEERAWEQVSTGLRGPAGRRAAALAWLPGTQTLLMFGGEQYVGVRRFWSDLWRLDLDKARLWDKAYAAYLEAIADEADGGGADAPRPRTDEININLRWLDDLFVDLPLWASATIVFGLPCFCLCLCICSGLYRQRRRAQARKRAEARERAHAEAEDDS